MGTMNKLSIWVNGGNWIGVVMLLIMLIGKFDIVGLVVMLVNLFMGVVNFPWASWNKLEGEE